MSGESYIGWLFQALKTIFKTISAEATDEELINIKEGESYELHTLSKWSDKIMTAFKAVEGVQQYCNILGRATASLSAAFTCICYILADMYTHMSLSIYYTFEQLLLQFAERCINFLIAQSYCKVMYV